MLSELNNAMARMINCILFCEFHPTAGPKIVYQAPEDYISKEEFDCVAVYIIPKPELQSKLITVNALNQKFIGCPISIENAKYSRNALVFNVCFVFDADADTAGYESVVKKLTDYLTTLELEDGFLSREETKAALPGILSKILKGLNEDGQCTIPVDDANTIHLKPIYTSEDPPRVLDHQVPIFVWGKDTLTSTNWDITTDQILAYIDGFNHVQRIASEADIELSLVRMCIQNMVHYGVVKLISVFQYSNVYIPTPEINQLAENSDLQEECSCYVSKRDWPLPTFRDVFMLYCGLSPGATVKDLCARYNPSALHIDERRLIQFGLVRGFIRRLHKFPVLLTKPKRTERPKTQHGVKGKPRESQTDLNKLKLLTKWLNGNHNYDEICCKTGLSYQEVEDIVESDPHVVVIWK